MTVSSQTNNATFVGNGVTTVFPLPFRFFSNGDVFAYFIDPATGASTPMVLGTDYTLAGAAEPEVNGNAVSVLTTTAPLANGRGLYVERIMQEVQNTDIVNQGEFFASTHEDVFDRLTMLIQQANANSQGAIRVAIGDPEPGRLAPIAQRAGKLMGFDANGNPIATDLAAVDPQQFFFNQALTGSFRADQTPPARIHRMTDRLFMGDGVKSSGSNSGSTSWLGNSPQPGLAWIERASWLYVANSPNFAPGAVAIAGAATNKRAGVNAGSLAIALVGAAVNDNPAGGGCWAQYLDAKSSATTNSATWGIEIAVCNLGAYVPPESPSPRKTYGITLQAGADTEINGVTDSCTMAIGFGSTGANWGTGLFFGDGSMRPHTDTLGTYYKTVVMRTGMGIGWESSDGNADSYGFIRSYVTSTANATSLTLDNGSVSVRDNALDSIVRFAKGATSANRVVISSASGSPSIAVEGSSTNAGLGISTKGTGSLSLNVGATVALHASTLGVAFGATIGNTGENFRVGANATAVNFLSTTGSNSGAGIVSFVANGTDTNLDVLFTPKGTGTVRFGTWTSNADAAVNGYVTIKDAAGNTRKLATIA